MNFDWLFRRNPPAGGFFVVKTEKGLRFFTVYSNKFQDRQGDIITEAAHREYIEWADKHRTYPELHVWHAGPSTKWGQVDCLDYVDGFAVASGLIDPGRENVYKAFKSRGDVGVSHGFFARVKGNDITAYRTYEISIAPMEVAVNPYTKFLTQEDFAMPFTPEKRKFLKDAMSVDDAALDQWEKSLSDDGQRLVDMGVAFKTQMDGDLKTVSENMQVLNKANEDLKTQIGELVTSVKTLTTTVTELQKSADDRLTSLLDSRRTPAPSAVRPTEEATQVTQKKASNFLFDRVVTPLIAQEVS